MKETLSGIYLASCFIDGATEAVFPLSANYWRCFGHPRCPPGADNEMKVRPQVRQWGLTTFKLTRHKKKSWSNQKKRHMVFKKMTTKIMNSWNRSIWLGQVDLRRFPWDKEGKKNILSRRNIRCKGPVAKREWPMWLAAETEVLAWIATLLKRQGAARTGRNCILWEAMKTHWSNGKLHFLKWDYRQECSIFLAHLVWVFKEAFWF